MGSPITLEFFAAPSEGLRPRAFVYTLKCERLHLTVFLNTLNQPRQLRRGDPVINRPAPSLTVEQTMSFQQPQMLTGLIRVCLARLGDFMHRKLTLHQDINHLQPHRMRHHFQTLGGAFKRLIRQQIQFPRCQSHLFHRSYLKIPTIVRLSIAEAAGYNSSPGFSARYRASPILRSHRAFAQLYASIYREFSICQTIYEKFPSHRTKARLPLFFAIKIIKLPLFC